MAVWPLEGARQRGPRAAVVRRGKLLAWATLGYNALEGLVAVGAGLAAGSIALVGFGVDSGIELAATLAALWRLHAEPEARRRERAELVALRTVGGLFLALAAYVAVDAVRTLVTGTAPDESPVGIVLAALSLIVMPLLVRAKRRVAVALDSSALAAEAQQTMICTYLSAILLGGLLVNAVLGWWWADPAAALAMVPLIVREGWTGLRGRPTCTCPT
jgi:divalent metal cation (Fe/Co/Zn/Cd) transporter